jgi:hypothetical protein
MKKILAFALVAGFVGAAVGQTSVSIGINQPGVYGRISIGDVPPPALVLPQPVIIERQPVVYQRAPIYLYVPPAHQHNWRRYCGRYGACNQPVYFVRDEWVRERYQSEHPGRGRGHDKGHHHKGHDHKGHDHKGHHHKSHDHKGHGKGKGHD